ncbi:hypothetical protein, partial [uncultured Gimesia sp.]|uniref:hypothetical protein n=1 Tax=uncultured Gimesia sp. TaxID=1678688 RepID=UPI00262E88A8
HESASTNLFEYMNAKSFSNAEIRFIDVLRSSFLSVGCGEVIVKYYTVIETGCEEMQKTQDHNGGVYLSESKVEPA